LVFKFYKCPVETHVNTSAKYDIVLYSITKVSGKRAQLFVQMLEKPKRTSSVCYDTCYTRYKGPCSAFESIMAKTTTTD
jgi:hypothetical protein